MPESKARILFVDDEERILRSLKLMFRGQYQIETANSGEEAIELLQRQPVDVIVSDQRMPGMQGTEVLRNAREIAPDAVRILLTGYSDMDAIVGSVNDGEIFRYIHKPWRPDAIRDTLAQAVDIARNTRDAVQQPVPAPEPTQADAGDMPIVLVIDQDPALQQLVRERVGDRFQVLAVTKVDEALGKLVSEDIAIIVTELHIDGINLSPVIKSLKHNNPGVPALVVTNFQDNGALIDLINQGQIFRFLRKPVSAKLLASGIEQAYQHQRALKADPRLAARYAVEEQNETSLRALPAQIMGFIRRLGGARANPAGAE
ncbi:MAG: response regulator [Gammaproteobacteria bacterium]|jgi:DNA-binding NtrC family response regulator